MATNGTLNFNAYINTTQFLNGINQMRAGINSLPTAGTQSINALQNTFQSGLSRIGKLFGTYLAFSQIKDFGKQIIEVRSEMQSLELAFQTMLKSKSAADKFMRDVVEFAAKTPFNVTEVGAAAKSLVAYRFAAADVIPIIRMLGDLSSGLKIPLSSLIYLYGTLKTQDRAYQRDITQFASRGIPIYDELAKVLGINVDQVRNFVTAGKVGFKEVEQAFKNMTSEGGQFYDLTAKNSQTLNGLLSNLGDRFVQMYNEIGESQQGLIVDSIKGVGNLVDNYEDVFKILSSIIAAYGAYRVAVFLVADAMKATGIIATTRLYLSLALSIRTAADAQAFLSLVMNAAATTIIPIAIAAVVGLAVAYALYSDNLTIAEKAQQELNDQEEKAKKLQDDRVAKTNELMRVLQDENATRFQQVVAFRELSAMYPEMFKLMDLDAFKKQEATRVQKDLNAALDNFSADNLKSQYEEAQKAVAKYNQEIKELNSSTGGDPTGELLKGLVEKSNVAEEKVNQLAKALAQLKEDELNAAPNDVQAKHYQTLVDSLKERKAELQLAIKKEEEMAKVGESLTVIFQQWSIEQFNQQILAAEKSLARLKEGVAGNTAEVKDYAYWQAQLKKAQEGLQALDSNTQINTKEWKDYAKQIAVAQKNLDKYNLTSKKRKDDEIFAAGSLRQLDKIAKDAKEKLEKSRGDDLGEIQRLNQVRFDAETKAAEIRKSLEIRTFDEELKYKKEQYEKYNNYVLFLNQTAADEAFKDLQDKGSTYIDYLQNQVDQLGNKIQAGSDTVEDRKNFVAANDALDKETQKFEKYRDSIEAAKEEVSTLTDYLILLQDERANLNQADLQKMEFLSQKIVETERERNRLLSDFVIQTNAGGAGIAQIKRYYESLRATILDNAKKQTMPMNFVAIAGMAVQLKATAKAESEAVGDMAVATVKKSSQAYKELNRIILADQKTVIKKRLEQLERYRQDLKKGQAGDTDEFNRVTDDILQAKKDLEDLNIQGYNDLLGIVQNIGSSFEGIDGSLGEIGKGLSGLASAGGTLSNVLAGISSGNIVQVIGAVLDGVVKIFATIAKNRADNKEFLKERELAIKAQERQYSAAIREANRLKSIENGNPFVKNYQGVIKDTSEGLKASTKAYEESVKKLQNGVVKAGTRDFVDSKDIFQSLVLGPLGALATVMFGAKTTDAYLPLLKMYPKLVKTLQDGKKEFDVALAQSLIDNDRVDEATKQILEEVIANVEEMKKAEEQMKSILLDLVGQIGDQLRDNLVNAFKEGQSAAEAFGKTVSQVLEDMLAKTLFSTVFGKAFDNLTADFLKSMDVAEGGDGRLDDDLTRFFETYPQLADMYFKLLGDAREQAKKFGFDIFSSTSGTGANNSLSGAIKGITEQTAGIIAGQLNAIRIYQAQAVDINRQQLVTLTLISKSLTAYLPFLQAMDYKLGVLATSTDISRTKGIKVYF